MAQEWQKCLHWEESVTLPLQPETHVDVTQIFFLTPHP